MFNDNGTLNSGWNALSQGVFQSTGAADNFKAALYGTSSVNHDDPSNNINQGFLNTNGPFASVALAV